MTDRSSGGSGGTGRRENKPPPSRSRPAVIMHCASRFRVMGCEAVRAGARWLPARRVHWGAARLSRAQAAERSTRRPPTLTGARAPPTPPRSSPQPLQESAGRSPSHRKHCHPSGAPPCGQSPRLRLERHVHWLRRRPGGLGRGHPNDSASPHSFLPHPHPPPALYSHIPMVL